jgi:hypothetical protein
MELFSHPLVATAAAATAPVTFTKVAVAFVTDTTAATSVFSSSFMLLA